MPPPRSKRRRTRSSQPAVETSVADAHEIQPRQAVADSGLASGALVDTIVTAVRAALTQSSESSQSSSSAVESAIADDTAQLVTGTEGELQPSSPLFQSIAVPLGSRVSAKLKSKIWADEFVDFGSLLDTSPNRDKYSLSFTAPNGSATAKTPQLTLEPVQSNKKVSTINEWLSAFHTYVAIYCVKYPGEIPNLMKFCESVRDIAARGGDWSYYDEQFRYVRQTNPKHYPWDIVHWELWHRAVTFRPKQNLFQSDRPNAKFKGNQSKGVRGVCWTYNAGRTCTGCRFEHKCSKCGGKHTGVQCQHASTGQSAGTTSQSYSKQPAGYARKSGST